MGDENHIRTLGDYSIPSHEGYRNTIEIPKGNNVGKNAHAFISISLRDQASNWLERLPAGSISTWEDLTTRFLAQFFPPGRTAKLRNDILIGPHDTQYCMENPEQAFVKYASSRTDEAGVLKAITDRMDGALPSNTVKNMKLNVNSSSPVLSARSYPTEDLQCSTHIHGSINAITIHPNQQSNSHDNKLKEDKQEGEGNLENTNAVKH
ncbi:MAK10-like protein [Tanacetum coccineum]